MPCKAMALKLSLMISFQCPYFISPRATTESDELKDIYDCSIQADLEPWVVRSRMNVGIHVNLNKTRINDTSVGSWTSRTGLM
jgi:hypothetical protein